MHVGPFMIAVRLPVPRETDGCPTLRLVYVIKVMLTRSKTARNSITNVDLVFRNPYLLAHIISFLGRDRRHFKILGAVCVYFRHPLVMEEIFKVLVVDKWSRYFQFYMERSSRFCEQKILTIERDYSEKKLKKVKKHLKLCYLLRKAGEISAWNVRLTINSRCDCADVSPFRDVCHVELDEVSHDDCATLT